MSKTAFLFPGQGAQKRGMGQSFCEGDADARAVFELASELLSIDMKALMFEPDERLNLTEYTQPAMVTCGIAMLQAVQKTGLAADVCAGLSLGEYEALYLSGAVSAEDAIKTVRERGLLMSQAVPVGQGTMAAVLGAETERVEELLKPFPGVWIANYNCPGQIVISGETEAVGKASEALKSAGIRRVLPLKVSGPFHSGLLAEAGEKLNSYLEHVTFHKPKIPYVANFTAEYVEDETAVRELLVRQVSGAVRFEQSIRAMLADGVTRFVEIGPGKTLSAFVKKIDGGAETLSIENIEDLEKI